MALISSSTEPRLESDLTAEQTPVLQALDKVQSIGGSSIYDSIQIAIDMISHEKLKAYRRYIIVFSDGGDKSSQTPLKTLTGRIKDLFVRQNLNLIIVGLSGNNPDFSDLKLIATSGDGKFTLGSMDSIQSIFREIDESL